MPCMCYYHPSGEDEKKFKKLCGDLVEFIKELRDKGDPIGMGIGDAHKLIDHLYDPEICKEKNGMD